MPRTALILVWVCLVTAPACASETSIQSEQANFRVETLVEALDQPWSLAFLPDGRMLITERSGGLRVVENGRLLSAPVKGTPEVAVKGQGGLLDVAIHPDFETNGWIYLTYSAKGPGGMGTELARGRLVDSDRLESVEVLYRAEPKSGGGRHFGSRLAFAPDGTLFMSLGERGDDDRAQDLSDPAGSIIRLRDDGSIPPDNPFVGQAGVRPEIFSYGNRNPQGLAVHPSTGELWAHEHGPRGGDEVNIIRAGANYGWPVITHGVAYSGFKIGEGTRKAGMEQPVHFWDPSIAPSGMAFYTGDAFPQWQGDLLVGALKFQLLVRLELDGERVVDEERLLEQDLGRIRDVRQGPDGNIYLLAGEGGGVLVRLSPSG